jgi:hypothetical protein
VCLPVPAPAGARVPLLLPASLAAWIVTPRPAALTTATAEYSRKLINMSKTKSRCNSKGICWVYKAYTGVCSVKRCSQVQHLICSAYEWGVVLQASALTELSAGKLTSMQQQMTWASDAMPYKPLAGSCCSLHVGYDIYCSPAHSLRACKTQQQPHGVQVELLPTCSCSSAAFVDISPPSSAS